MALYSLFFCGECIRQLLSIKRLKGCRRILSANGECGVIQNEEKQWYNNEFIFPSNIPLRYSPQIFHYNIPRATHYLASNFTCSTCYNAFQFQYYVLQLCVAKFDRWTFVKLICCAKRILNSRRGSYPLPYDRNQYKTR